MSGSRGMEVLQEVAAGFLAATRSRGEGYAQQGRVALMELPHLGEAGSHGVAASHGLVGAEVRGQEVYDVWLLFDAHKREVVVNCDCPVGLSEVKCKHAWAVLATLAERGVLAGLEAGVGEDWTSMFGDFRFEDDLPGAVGDAFVWMDPEAVVEVFPRSGRNRFVDLAQNRPFGGDPAAGSSVELDVVGWAERIDRAVQATAQEAMSVQARGPSPEKPRDYFYGLCVLEHDPPRLGVTVHSRRRDNQEGTQFRTESATEGPNWRAAPRSPDDARALAVLRAAALGAGDGMPWHHGSKRDPVRVDAAVAPALLEALCATGRCHMHAASGGVPNAGPRVHWDGPEPWAVQLRLAGEPGDAELTLSAQGVRGEHVLNWDPPAGVLGVREAMVYPRPEAQGGGMCVAPLGDADALPWMHLLGGPAAVRVPRDDVPALIARLFGRPGLPPLCLPDHLKVDEVDLDVAGVLRVMRPEGGRRRDSEVLAEVAFAYGDDVLSAGDPRRGVFDLDARVAAPRRFDDEQRLAQRAAQLGERRGRAPAGQDDEVPREWVAFDADALGGVVQALTAEGWRVEADDRPLRVAKGDFNLSVRSGIDWFDVEGQAAFDDQTLTLADLLGAVKRGEHFVTLGDGSAAMLPDRWLERYAPLAQLGEASQDGRRMAAGQVGLLDALLEAMPEARFDRTVAAARKRLTGLKQVKAKNPPRGFVGELRDYQKQGLGWLEALAKLGLNGCLADDMGLGKTIQVLAWLEGRRAAGARQNAGHTDRAAPRTSVVVVPRSLIDNWQREAQRFTPRLRVRDHTGPKRWAGVDASLGAQGFDCDVLLTTYGTLRRDAARLAGVAFDVAVLDEAQAIKNPKTAAAKAARLINAQHRLAVSGTPVENHLGELVSLFDFLNPGMLDGAAGLLDRAAKVSLPVDSEDTAPSAAHAELDVARVLSRAVGPFVLRRTKSQVAPELPARQEETLYCEMQPKQAKYYERLAAQYRASLLKKIEVNGLNRSKMQVLEALLRLRQAACHPALVDETQASLPSAKLEMLFGRLDTLREQGAKVLVFSQFVKLLRLVRDRLDADAVDYAYLDGRTRKRQDAVDRFQTDPDCRLMLISLKAGGTGLNLTAAEYVFLLDPWWNPAVEAQAIDRAHRIGQTRTVFAHRLIAKGTVEEKVLELQQGKRDLADAILGDPASVMKTLKLDDLKMLLG